MLFCNMTLSLSHWGGAYFSTLLSQAGPQTALTNRVRKWSYSTRSPSLPKFSFHSQNTCSWDITLGNQPARMKYDYTETTTEKPQRMTDPCEEAKEHRGTRNAGEGAIMEVDPPGSASAMCKQWPRMSPSQINDPWNHEQNKMVRSRGQTEDSI